MTHHDTHTGALPEDRFDQWLDGFVAGTPADAESLNGTDGSLGRAMSSARQLHGLAAGTTPAAAAQRRIEEDLMRSGALAAPRGTTWIPIEKDARRTPWWSPTSPVIAGALIVALIVSLGASFIATQRPAEGPTPAPGFAMASPSTTTDGSLSCGAPGYVPVIVSDDVPDTGSTAELGGPPIVIGEDVVTATMADGETLSVPSGTSSWVRGNAIITIQEDNSKTITRLSDGKQWDLPAADATVDGNSRYIITATDDSLTNLVILDIETGDMTTTADILGAPFVRPVELQNMYMTDEAGAVSTMYIATDPTGSADDPPTPEFPGVLVIPGSLSDAYFTMLAADTQVSPDGKLLISIHEVFDAQTGDRILHDGEPVRFDGEPIGFAADAEHLLVIEDGDIHEIDLTTGGDEVRFAPEGDVQVVGYDRAAQTLVAGIGADTAVTWVWVDLVTGEQIPLPELDGYELSGSQSGYSYHLQPLDGIAQFNRESDDTPWIVRGLDMATGKVTSSTLRHYVVEDRAWVVLSPVLAEDGYIVARGSNGAISVLSPATDTMTDLGFPAEAERLARGSFFQTVRVSPSGSCLLLTIQSEGNHSSFVTPIQPGGAWTELPFAVSGWVESGDADDAQILPAQDFATPASCATTPPNGDVPPGESDDLDWLGSGTENPSLWLMMTWDDGTIETNQVAEGYPVKLTFWRGEGSGEIAVTATGPNGEKLPASTFEPFQGDPIPGIHPFGGTLPEPGCWTFTATDGNDTLTWTVDVEPMHVTSISVTAKADIVISVTSVTASGRSVWDGELEAGDTAGPFEGSEIEVYTSSGENTLFTNACSDHPFNMGYQPGEAYYIFRADAASCPPGATPPAAPVASPVAVE